MNDIRLRRLKEHVVLSRSWHAKNPTAKRYPHNRYPGSWTDICHVAANVVRQREVPSSLRYVFYRLVTMDILMNTLSDYTQLTQNTAEARRDGWFPRLVDHNREIYRPATYGNLAEQLKAEAGREVDRDLGQPYALFVAIEKQTVAESVKHWLRPYGVPIIVLRGYASQTLIDEVGDDAEEEADLEVAEAAEDVLGMARTEKRPLVLLTIGDFDASGDHLMDLFVERTDCWNRVVKVGVDFDQAQTLPQAPAKKTDTRLPGFVKRHWPDDYTRLMRDMRDRTPQQRAARMAEIACQVEVEALEAAATDDDPEPLRTLLLDALEEFWDDSTYQARLEVERRNRRILRALADRPEDEIAAWLGMAS